MDFGIIWLRAALSITINFLNVKSQNASSARYQGFTWGRAE